MKVAVLLSGQVRTFEEFFPTLEQFIFRDYNPDVFCYAPQEPESLRLSRYQFCFVGIDDVPWISDRQYQGKATMPTKSWYGAEFVAQAHLRRLWGLYQVCQFKKMREQMLGVKYDWVIRARYDLEYLSFIESLEELNSDRIYIPRHDNWGGYCDRFAFGSSELMDIYCDSWLTAEENFKEVGYMHSEPHLKWHLDRAGVEVRRTQVNFNTVRHGECWKPCYHTHLGDG